MKCKHSLIVCSALFVNWGRGGCCPDCSVERSELARIQLPNATIVFGKQLMGVAYFLGVVSSLAIKIVR